MLQTHKPIVLLEAPLKEVGLKCADAFSPDRDLCIHRVIVGHSRNKLARSLSTNCQRSSNASWNGDMLRLQCHIGFHPGQTPGQSGLPQIWYLFTAIRKRLIFTCYTKPFQEKIYTRSGCVYMRCFIVQ